MVGRGERKGREKENKTIAILGKKEHHKQIPELAQPFILNIVECQCAQVVQQISMRRKKGKLNEKYAESRG